MSKPRLRLRLSRRRSLVAAGLLAGGLALSQGVMAASAEPASQSVAPASACTVGLGNLCVDVTSASPGTVCVLSCSAPAPTVPAAPTSPPCVLSLLGLCVTTTTNSGTGGGGSGSGSDAPCGLLCVGTPTCALGATGACLVGGGSVPVTSPQLPTVPLGSGSSSGPGAVPQPAADPQAIAAPLLSVTGAGLAGAQDAAPGPNSAFGQAANGGSRDVADGGGLPNIEQLGPASGLSFGKGLNLWIIFLILDAIAAAFAVGVVRRTWKTRGQD